MLQLQTISSASLVLKSDAAEDSQIPEQIQTSLTSVSKSRKISKSTVTVTKSKENSKANRGSLVQPTISTLFKKVGEKKEPRGSDKSSSTKVLGKKLQSNNYKRKIDQTEGSSKKGKVNEEKTTGGCTSHLHGIFHLNEPKGEHGFGEAGKLSSTVKVLVMEMDDALSAVGIVAMLQKMILHPVACV
ncbi:hypothetical protein QUC31_010307 [Theobroma cacao]